MKKKIEIFLVFIILFLSVFYLVNYDFSDIFGREVESREKIPSYWLEKYGMIVLAEEDLELDSDGDNLTLLEEYNYKTSPLKFDTDGDGYSDGQEVENGYSPIGEGKMDYDNDKLPDLWEIKNGLSLKINDYGLDPDGDGMENYLEYEYSTNPQDPDTDGDGYDDLVEIKNGYDPTIEGNKRPSLKLSIDKLNISAPMIFSASYIEDNMQEELKSGVVIYPETGIPGQHGNTVVSGHSSNYSWIQGAYNYVFKDLNSLNVGDEILIESLYENGKRFEYKYVITSKEVLNPNDEKIFASSGERVITVATCWPLGTNFSRLIVKAKME
ncbi:sortase [Patescibacteria group bacterium]